MMCQVGFLISPVMPEHSGQYWCTATYGDKTSEYGVSLNVLMQTRWVVCSSPTVLGKMGKINAPYSNNGGCDIFIRMGTSL